MDPHLGTGTGGGTGTAGWQAGGTLQKAEGTTQPRARPQALPARGSPWVFLEPGISEATAWATSQSPKLRKGRNPQLGPLLTPSPVGLGSYRSWMVGPQRSLVNSQVLSPRCPGSVSSMAGRGDGLLLQMNSIQLITTDQFLGPVTALRTQPPPAHVVNKDFPAHTRWYRQRLLSWSPLYPQYTEGAQ